MSGSDTARGREWNNEPACDYDTKARGSSPEKIGQNHHPGRGTYSTGEHIQFIEAGYPAENKRWLLFP